MTDALHQHQPDPLEQAADWHLRLSEDPACANDFQQWLAAGSAHQAAWEQIQRMLGGLDQLPHQQQPVHQTVARKRQRILPLALAASLIGLAVLLTPLLNLHWQADYLTGSGETLEAQLADGSLVTLAPGSAICVDFSPTRRTLHLLKGTAFFKVAHDAGKPFVVSAENTEVRVLGTRFDVALQAQAVTVDVEQGQVRVTDRHSPRLREELGAGERLHIDASGQVQRSRIAVEQVAAWRDGLLYVEDQSVQSIIDALQSHAGGWIVLTDPALGERRLSGVFDLNDRERALQGLAHSLAVETHSLGPWLSTLGSF